MTSLRAIAATARTIAILAILLVGPAATAAPAALAVGPIAMTVGDADRSAEFFEGVLDFRRTGDIEVVGHDVDRLTGLFGVRLRVVTMTLGDESVELMQFLVPTGRPMPADSRSNDRWFQHVAIITSDMDAAYARLRRHRVAHASTGPQTLPAWNTNAAGIRAFYFRDPDGHFLEVLQFPPGKGGPMWRESGGRLFLGIDHTAVVVADTEASLAFYRDRLGLQVAGESENYGPEQEHLNHVAGARLRITTLRAAHGPGIELLEYLNPRDGRSPPRDSRFNDLWHWQVRVDVADPASALTTMPATVAGGLLEPRVPAAPPWTASPLVIVRDPDGHVLALGDGTPSPTQRARRSESSRRP